MIWQFDKQLSKGEQAEAFLDNYFADKFEIRKVGRDEQRKGIDRIFINRQTNQSEKVEYKTDWKARYTHNAFIETVSVDSNGKKGWAETTEADVIFYYIPGDELVYVLKPLTIRKLLGSWSQKYPTRKAANDGYFTHGICVPLWELERCSNEVISF